MVKIDYNRMGKDMCSEVCHTEIMGFYEDFMAHLDSRIGEDKKWPNTNQAAKALDVAPIQLDRYLKGERKTFIQALGKIIDGLGAKLIAADNEEMARPSVREVCFISPRVTGVAEYDGIEAHVQPDADNYVAVPLVEQRVAAGPGLIPEHNIEDWMIVYTPALPILPGMRSLAAVRIGPGQTSMVPTLHPGDICLVDRRPIQDEPRPPGNIYLVQEPVETEGESPALAIKRVVFEHGRKDLRLQFYSDNAVEHPPRSYGLKERYGGEIHRAIVGRVVWAWTDVTRK